MPCSSDGQILRGDDTPSSSATIVDDPRLPHVLVLGDSICAGYALEVRKMLLGEANVECVSENCHTTRQALQGLEGFLGNESWDVIHFHFGMHDRPHLDAAHRARVAEEEVFEDSLEEYGQNLERIVERLKQTHAVLVWASMTPVGPSSRHQRPADVEAYNSRAAEVMKRHGVWVDDLFALVRLRMKQGRDPWKDGVQLTSDAQREQAEQVANVIRAALAQNLAGKSHTDVEAFKAALLDVDPAWSEKWRDAERRGLIEVSPIHLPIAPWGCNNHYGWPVGTSAGGTLLVLHRCIPGHNARLSGQADERTSYMVVLRSLDGGRTWSEPFDLRDVMTSDNRTRGGLLPLSARSKFEPANHSQAGYPVNMLALGTTRDGGVVAVGNYGVFRSEDQGRSWTHLPSAFRDDCLDPIAFGIGPQVIDDPTYGL
ncbi:MAG: GDSL-type esterase/lipase family protein, partial [Planctomycetota bacterium]